MITRLFGDRVDAQRRQATRQARGPLLDCLTTPLPDRALPAARVPMLAVDFETTGLNPDTDDLLSVGYVAVNGLEIDFSTAGQFVIRGAQEVGQSATVHGLTDDTVAAGVTLHKAITAIVKALRGRVMLAHFADIEEKFLDRACRDLFGAGLPLLSVDTMMLQHHVLAHSNTHHGSVRLWGARERYGLPVYRAHEALTDAVACAELFLAQVAEIGPTTPLRKLVRWSA
ncbi:exonuclease domain-containing protein [Granulicoccus sp. GXG6511]|uniref:exonuclease domain-containing protein n=1 Tax=Granulicoccus sp. GXG6511 TaxID=3381351 RepID=UPI003D7D79D3